MSKIILNGIEYSNGITYQELQPVIYSDEEREVGVWRDGKPLYQKTISFGALPNSTSKSVAHGISDLDKIVDFSALAKRPEPFNIIPLPSSHYQSTSAQQEISFNATNITIRNGNNASAYTDVYVTLQYTKTTDTAGSGSWTPSGVKAVHYSTNEQVIGTFLGKPLYEKTFELDNVTIPTSGYAYSLSGLNLNIENVIKNPDCFIVYGGTNCLTLPYNVDTPYFIISEFIKENSDGVMFFRRGGSNLATDKIIFTLQYTKTTD